MSTQLSGPLPLALSRPEDARRRYGVRRQLRAARRGLFLAALVYFVVLSGVLPMSAAAGNVLLGLATVLGITRAARGLWALRVARHLMMGWGARRGLGRRRYPELAGPAPASIEARTADQRAIFALTASADADPGGIYGQARTRGLALVQHLTELRALLADSTLAEVLRRPVAESLARAEDDLGALTHALTALSRADQADQPDLIEKLAARLEVEVPVPTGLYAPA